MFRLIVRVFIAAIFFALVGCANRSRGPQGGPKDTIPPRPVNSTPQAGAVNFKGKNIEINFDEFISLKSQDNIVVSPPQVIPPTISSNARKVSLVLKDSLKENTSYTIDFGSCIVDLNEQNPMHDYTFSFSTGAVLDTLQISGTVLDASNLNPLSKVIVGIYPANMSIDDFKKNVPLRIAKSNDMGRFCIKNVKAGSYRIVALNDLNADYKYSDSNEQVAFDEALITPSAQQAMVADTIRTLPQPKAKHSKHSKQPKPAKQANDTLKKDSVRQVQKTLFLPNDLVLRAFKKEVYKQYYQKTDRKNPYRVIFTFNTYNKQRPVVKPLNFVASRNDVVQYSPKSDTITYWLSDSLTIHTDTLKFAVSYKRTNATTGQLVDGTDTIDAINIQKKGKKAKKAPKASAPKFLTVQTNVVSPFDLYSPINLYFDRPLKSMDEKKIHLLCKKDSVWKDLPVKVQRADSLGFKYSIANNWDSESDYKLRIDSGAIYNLYNQHNDKQETPFKVKAANLYASLKVTLLKYNDKAILQLLDDKDNVVQQLPANTKGTTFEHLIPGNYYLRLYIDANQNGQWDVGSYEEKRQPEEVYYFNQVLNLRPNWDFEQEWDYSSLPLDRQKPLQLSKAATATSTGNQPKANAASK